MRIAVILAAAGALAAQAASTVGAQPAKIDRAVFTKVSEGLDNGFRALWPDNPLEVVGVTHAVYIHGYGVVLSGELNLAPGLNTTPFHPTITKQDVARTRQTKMDRMGALRNAMQDLLVKSAAQLRDVPDNEEIALAVVLFYWHWEDRSGLPDQLVVHASRKALLAAGTDKAAVASAVHFEEY
jgi:hypothetical protein